MQLGLWRAADFVSSYLLVKICQSTLKYKPIYLEYSAKILTLFFLKSALNCIIIITYFIVSVPRRRVECIVLQIMWYYCFLISIFICVLSCTICINSTILHHRLGQTCIWPRPPRLNQPDPDRWILQQRISRISEDLTDVIVEDGQTGVVRQTSVDSCEPVDSFSVNLVTRRVV